jgi:hypothetical protein
MDQHTPLARSLLATTVIVIISIGTPTQATASTPGAAPTSAPTQTGGDNYTTECPDAFQYTAECQAIKYVSAWANRFAAERGTTPGERNALRHGILAAGLRAYLGLPKARSILEAHEYGGAGRDTEIDWHNNEVGLEIGRHASRKWWQLGVDEDRIEDQVWAALPVKQEAFAPRPDPSKMLDVSSPEG